MIHVDKNQIVLQKVIGSHKGQDIHYAKVKGGYHIVYKQENGHTKVLGASSHKAVAKYKAKANEPEIEFTELSKSDEYSVEDFKHLLPEADELTKFLQNLETKSNVQE